MGRSAVIALLVAAVLATILFLCAAARDRAVTASAWLLCAGALLAGAFAMAMFPR